MDSPCSLTQLFPVDEDTQLQIAASLALLELPTQNSNTASARPMPTTRTHPLCIHISDVGHEVLLCMLSLPRNSLSPRPLPPASLLFTYTHSTIFHLIYLLRRPSHTVATANLRHNRQHQMPTHQSMRQRPNSARRCNMRGSSIRVY